jgi:TatD DNase family protein
MIPLIDTHAHIYVEEFDDDRDAVIARAQEAGVKRILLPAIDSENHERMLAACQRYPDMCVPMMGVHPTSVNDNPRWREELTIVEQHLRDGRFCAVGEIGLDFYWSNDFRAEQIEAFRTQIGWALQHDLPVVLHMRNATGEMADIVGEFPALRGLFHAFSGSIETYRRLKSYGNFCFGIGGVITFKNSKLADVVQQMELQDIVLETDAPYLTPAPYRGKRNESAYIPYICRRIAELKGLSEEEVAEQTTRNAERIFNI